MANKADTENKTRLTNEQMAHIERLYGNVWRDFDYLSNDFPQTFVRRGWNDFGEDTVIFSLREYMTMIRANAPHKTFKTVKDGLGWTIKVKLEAWQL